MTLSALDAPQLDPTPIFEAFRGSFGSELLTAAAAHFNLFGRLAEGPRSFEKLCDELELAERPAVVLTTAMRAMGLVDRDGEGRFELTPIAREHLVPGTPFDVSGYLGMATDSPGVVEMVERLRSNRPAGADDEAGAAFIFREGIESAMEQETSARAFTMALAGRAKNVAPSLAEHAAIDGAKLLLDVGGGTGIYSIAFLQKHTALRAVVLDRPEVLKVAAEMADEYGVADRLECQTFDMFTDPMPTGADVALLSNVLHDWDVRECRQLVGRSAEALAPGGRVLVHDVFLNDAHDGPLPIALYSAALMSVTEGRAYSGAEYSGWLSEAGLVPQTIVPTAIHCGVLAGVKPS